MDVDRKPVSAVAQRLGERVAHRRRMLGLNQHELAHAVGWSRSSVANLECGRQELPLSMAVALAEQLHTTVAALLGEVPAQEMPETAIRQGYQVICDKCGPVTFVASHDEAREFRTTHLRFAHLARPS